MKRIVVTMVAIYLALMVDQPLASNIGLAKKVHLDFSI